MNQVNWSSLVPNLERGSVLQSRFPPSHLPPAMCSVGALALPHKSSLEEPSWEGLPSRSRDCWLFGDVPPLSLLAASRPALLGSAGLHWGEGCEPAPSQPSSGGAPLALWRGPCLISQLGYRGSPPFYATGSGLGLAQRTLGQPPRKLSKPDSATGNTCFKSQIA